MKVPSPEGTLLEVGGLCTLPNGDLGSHYPAGAIFLLWKIQPMQNLISESLHQDCTKYWVWLTKTDATLRCATWRTDPFVDTDKDGKADVFETSLRVAYIR